MSCHIARINLMGSLGVLILFRSIKSYSASGIE